MKSVLRNIGIGLLTLFAGLSLFAVVPGKPADAALFKFINSPLSQRVAQVSTGVSFPGDRNYGRKYLLDRGEVHNANAPILSVRVPSGCDVLVYDINVITGSKRLVSTEKATGWNTINRPPVAKRQIKIVC